MAEPLTPAYEAEIREHVATMSNYTLGNLFARDLLAEIDRLRKERDRYQSAWQSARERAQAYSEGILRHVATRETVQGWLKQEQAATQHLRAELSKRPEETYPGELAHLRDLLQDVGRLADKQPEGNPVTELLIDHYSDSRMVDAELAKSEHFPQPTRGRARLDAKTVAEAEATHWRRLGITPEGGDR